jgi:hypothetical protein
MGGMKPTDGRDESKRLEGWKQKIGGMKAKDWRDESNRWKG